MAITNNWINAKGLPNDLITAKERVYDLCDFNCSEPQPEAESQDYDACDFQIDGKNFKFRTAKITPTKTGQFVTLWKRNKTGIIEPFDFNDAIDFVIVNVRKENLLGQFVFPKSILLQKGIFSTSVKEGIRATRVYPPWNETTSKQAQKTQKWQLDYFCEITPDVNLDKFKKLLQ